MFFVYDPHNTNRNPWKQAIHNQIHEHHSNWIQLTVGRPGRGKSSFNLSEALLLDPTFTIDTTRIAFSVKDFIRIINAFDEKKHSRGKVIMLEEVGVEASAKDWQSQTSKSLSNVLQTFRSQGLILLMSVPDDELLIKDGRRLLGGLFVAKGIDFKQKTVSTEPFSLDHNALRHKTYTEHLRKCTKRGDIIVDDWTLDLAVPEHWDKFETMMESYKKSVREREYNKLDAITVKGKRRVICKNCHFTWVPQRHTSGEIAPKCHKCYSKETIWEAKEADAVKTS